VNYKMSLI